MTESFIYLELDKESQQALAKAKVTVADLLRDQKMEVKVTYGQAPYTSIDGKRELVTIIVASGISAVLIGSAIEKVLRVYLRRPRYFEVRQIFESREADANGQLSRHVITRTEMHQPSEPKGTTELSGKILGTLIRFRDTKESGS